MGKASHQTLGEIERASSSLKVKEVSRCLINRESEHVFDDDAWRRSIAKLVMNSGPACHGTVGHFIYRVPEDIRACDARAYEPRAVCIGPYHYFRRDSQALRAMQDHKWRCVRYLVSRHRSLEDPSKKALLDACLKRMTDLDEQVRRCYSDEIKEGSHDLALMMLLDGCFILHCLVKQGESGEEGEVDEGDTGPLLRMPWIWNQVKHDLLLLENQIPFFVLQTIFDLLKTEDDGTDLGELAIRLLGNVLPQRIDSKHHSRIPRDQIYHLLHLVYLTILPTPEPSKSSTKPPAGEPPEWVPSATELQAAGVEIKKRKHAASFLDIRFSNGVMEIPPLEVYDFSNCFFRNLIAFEQCHPESLYHVTVYSAFMHCIINRPKDMRVLHQKGILISRTGTNEETTLFFSRLCYQVHYFPHRNYLGSLLMDVAKYRKMKRNKWRKWWVRYVRDYLSNPLTIISIATGIFLLIVATAQTFFAVYSYFLPPNKQ